MYVGCNDSTGMLQRKGIPFDENCSRCFFFDTREQYDCELSCEPIPCPPIPNDCTRKERSSDGCCMNCTSYGKPVILRVSSHI